MPKMEFLDPKEAKKINKQKRKQFWWTLCIFAYMITLYSINDSLPLKVVGHQRLSSFCECLSSCHGLRWPVIVVQDVPL